jgi:hypothetical protein
MHLRVINVVHHVSNIHNTCSQTYTITITHISQGKNKTWFFMLFEYDVHVCKSEYMYVCMYVCMQFSLYLKKNGFQFVYCMCVCECVCVCVCVYIYTYINPRDSGHKHSYTMYVCMCVCVCVYIHTYIYIHAYIHTYIHTLVDADHVFLDFNNTISDIYIYIYIYIYILVSTPGMCARPYDFMIQRAPGWSCLSKHFIFGLQA